MIFQYDLVRAEACYLKDADGMKATPHQRSVNVAPKTMAGEVQHDDDQHKHTNHGVEDLDSQGSRVVRLLFYFTPLLLLASPVAGQAPWFVHSQRRGHKQQQYGEAGSAHEFGLQRTKVGAEQCFYRSP